MIQIPVSPGVVAAVETTESAVSRWTPSSEELTVAATRPGARAASFLASRCLVRRLIDEVVDRKAADSPIVAGPAGKPYLPEVPGVGINLSGTDGHVAAVVGIGLLVGIDIEAVRPVGPDMIRRCCSPADARWIEALPAGDRDRELTRVWTVQEACVKAAGIGLAGRPWLIPVAPAQRVGQWNGYDWQTLSTSVDEPVSCAYRLVPADVEATDRAS
jgi:4'-phosphopantetheinyl transferase